MCFIQKWHTLLFLIICALSTEREAPEHLTLLGVVAPFTTEDSREPAPSSFLLISNGDLYGSHLYAVCLLGNCCCLLSLSNVGPPFHWFYCHNIEGFFLLLLHKLSEPYFNVLFYPGGLLLAHCFKLATGILLMMLERVCSLIRPSIARRNL